VCHAVQLRVDTLTDIDKKAQAIHTAIVSEAEESVARFNNLAGTQYSSLLLHWRCSCIYLCALSVPLGRVANAKSKAEKKSATVLEKIQAVSSARNADRKSFSDETLRLQSENDRLAQEGDSQFGHNAMACHLVPGTWYVPGARAQMCS
jgi:hypothetical protein